MCWKIHQYTKDGDNMELTEHEIEAIQVLILKRINDGTSIVGAKEYIGIYEKLEKMINEMG